MQAKRKTIHYPGATLKDLDAGVHISLGPHKQAPQERYAVPSFLIIGAQKCGTTALHQWLSIHPHLQTLPLEWNFFDQVVDLDKEWTRYVLQPYFRIVRQGSCHTFEKTTDYLDKTNQGKPVAHWIRRLMPSGKFIVLLRNPTERAWSAYKMLQHRAQNKLYGTTLRDATLRRLVARLTPPVAAQQTALPSFMASIQQAMDAVHHQATALDSDLYNLITAGQYAAHLRCWYQHFPRQQLFVGFLEDFQQDPFGFMKRVLKFLAVAQVDYKQVTEPDDKGFWVLQGKKAFTRGQHPIDPEAKALLDAYYAPWNDQLQHLLPDQQIPW